MLKLAIIQGLSPLKMRMTADQMPRVIIVAQDKTRKKPIASITPQFSYSVGMRYFGDHATKCRDINLSLQAYKSQDVIGVTQSLAIFNPTQDAVC